MIMGIIFDLDGTLLNTIADIARVTNYALVKNGFPPHDVNSYASMVGHGLKDLVTQALPENTSQIANQNVYDTLIQEYMKNPVQDSILYPGITDLLENLAIKKIPMAVLSNKLHEITEKIVVNIFKDWGFVSVFGARNGIPKKPSPVTAIAISKTMSIQPENILFVGDSEADIITAKACGMRPIGVSWGYRSIEQLRKSGAEDIVNTPLELLNYL
ncbi:MAG: HAD family hydrolase [Spirochaetia bacterium]|nr:HAD family hydrolase [Spirochaetia bacterium]